MIPYPLYAEVWNYDLPVPPPCPPPFDEQAYRRALAHLSDRRRRVGIYAGLGCVDASPSLAAVAELLAGAGGDLGQRQGMLPDAHPLAVGWGYGRQGTRAAEAAFKEVDLVLAVGVRFSEVSTANYAIPQHDVLIHVDVNPQNLGRNVPAHVAALLRLPRVPRSPSIRWRRSAPRRPAPGSGSTLQDLRQVDRCEAATVRITAASIPCSS